ncbi:TolC family protein [Flavobacterium saliperosum]|uniref:Outer membrane protein TolC n=1 Tax=Flavobacterium saliperosum TaxID=329186 RepID=A0A1G4W016_9FLAO|nr:TolC family protein [Flavobacterium saliperosum]SCX14630.1 Outer membrane protein TolC [Flavobacterium saliperosum]
MKKIFQILLLLTAPTIWAQEKLTLEKCYELAEKNYPLAKQNRLLQNQSELHSEILSKDRLPKVTLNAQATYQSEVTQVPFSMPNTTIDPLNKDQYRATIDVNQLIYNGGIIKAQTQLKESQIKAQQQLVEVNLYQLKSFINQYYFGLLLGQEKQELLHAKKKLLQEKSKEIQAALKFGAVLPSSEQVIEAEIIKINQQLNDVKYDLLKLWQHLEQLSGTKFNPNTILEIPKNFSSENKTIRPELELFELQNQQINASQKVITTTNLPKLNAFLQGGYGNPALNMLNNSFETFYMTGVRLNWTLFDWNKTKKEKEVLEISKQLIASEKETFEVNQNRQLQEADFEIEKIKEQLNSDSEIIQLREKIVRSAEAQMKNGVITSSDYLNDVTQLFESKITEKTHRIQLLLAKVNHQIIKGI